MNGWRFFLGSAASSQEDNEHDDDGKKGTPSRIYMSCDAQRVLSILESKNTWTMCEAGRLQCDKT
jgi:hypothetical protein